MNVSSQELPGCTLKTGYARLGGLPGDNKHYRKYANASHVRSHLEVRAVRSAEFTVQLGDFHHVRARSNLRCTHCPLNGADSNFD